MEKWKSDYLMVQTKGFGDMKKKYEMSVVIPVIFNTLNLEIRPELQKFVLRSESNKNAFIDLYYEEIKLAIEVDEKYHDTKQEHDIARQREIENELGCEFLRIDAKAEEFNAFLAIKKINDRIAEKIAERKNLNSFKRWPKPPTKSLGMITDELKNTIIMKTVKRDGIDVIPYHTISEKIRSNAKQVIVFSGTGEYHEGYIGFATFKVEDFLTSSDNPTLVSPTGSTITNSPYLNTYIKKWDANRSVIYSKDLNKFIQKRKNRKKKK